MKTIPKKLYVPDHVKRSIERGAKVEPVSVDKAFVKPEERVLDPSKLDASIMERLPQPTGWRILVMPYQGRAATKGGLILPDGARDKEALATVVAYVLKVGPDAYKDTSRFDKPWCAENQWVCIGRYAGSRFKLDDGEIRIINDDEVIATILNPDDIYSV